MEQVQQISSLIIELNSRLAALPVPARVSLGDQVAQELLGANVLTSYQYEDDSWSGAWRVGTSVLLLQVQFEPGLQRR